MWINLSAEVATFLIFIKQVTGFALIGVGSDIYSQMSTKWIRSCTQLYKTKEKIQFSGLKLRSTSQCELNTLSLFTMHYISALFSGAATNKYFQYGLFCGLVASLIA